jgi:hypothetical protein
MIANANASQADGNTVSARESFLRAVTYNRTSSNFPYRPALDPAFAHAFDLQRDAFPQAAPLSDWTIENAEDAGQHDEAGAAALFFQRVFDWLDSTLV